jgi:hypothetical protein
VNHFFATISHHAKTHLLSIVLADFRLLDLGKKGSASDLFSARAAGGLSGHTWLVGLAIRLNKRLHTSNSAGRDQRQTVCHEPPFA